MMRSFAARLILLTCCVTAPVTAIASPIAHLTLQSQPGDWIGQGGTYDLVYQSPLDSISAQIWSILPDGSPGNLVFVLLDQVPTANYAMLFFGTHQLGMAIQPGLYLDAERAPFATPGHPGLDISFQHRGSNTLTGWFRIIEATFFLDPVAGLQVATFQAEFEQHSEGAVPALFGTFRYDAAGVPVPEPGTILLCASAAALGLMRWRALSRAAASLSKIGSRLRTPTS